MLDPIIAGRILFIAGITNLIFLLMVFFSCRCLLGAKMASWLTKHSWYNKFYTKHCYFWWLFFASVIIHTFLGFYLFGFTLL